MQCLARIQIDCQDCRDPDLVRAIVARLHGDADAAIALSAGGTTSDANDGRWHITLPNNLAALLRDGGSLGVAFLCDGRRVVIEAELP